jgi:hypothetical protein
MVGNVPSGESILFMARTNRTILNFIRYIYGLPPDSLLRTAKIRWAAPSLLNSLLSVMADEEESICNVLGRAQEPLDDARGPMDGVVLRILEAAADIDGENAVVNASPFAQFACQLLSTPAGAVTMATIHAAKGAEHHHVFLDQYNLIGGPEGSQERNLLYIAITRAKKNTDVPATREVTARAERAPSHRHHSHVQ